ncbi:MAG: 4Fe-4S binding protein [Oscillospiraceae bacterium]
MNQESVAYSGVISEKLLTGLPGVPSAQRLELGPVACIECSQQIPCNPCEEACPRHAITVGAAITALPVLDENLCNGCGLCITRCPGLAIFNVHRNYSESTSLVSFPYEYYPLPVEDSAVRCGGRDGGYLTMGTVRRVLTHPSFDKTAVVTVEVPKEFCMSVRTLCREGGLTNGT